MHFAYCPLSAMLESNKNEELHNRAAPFDSHIDEFIEFLNLHYFGFFTNKYGNLYPVKCVDIDNDLFLKSTKATIACLSLGFDLSQNILVYSATSCP